MNRVSLILCCLGLVTPLRAAEPIVCWANNGEHKVARERRPVLDEATIVRNHLWDGTAISLLAARNETVAFNLVIEAGDEPLQDVTVELSDLVQTRSGREVARLSGWDNTSEALFDYRGRHAELFFVRYLPIEGLSVLAYDHDDERHVPERFRRPHDANGNAQGDWTDRPDHDRSYPDIAVPLGWESPFSVAARTSQAVWADVYVPHETPPGRYQGDVTVTAAGRLPRVIPVWLDVRAFTLPDLPSARTMLYVSESDISRRYFGQNNVSPSDDQRDAFRRVVDRHFQMAHRHRVSLIGDHVPVDRVDAEWRRRLDGSLFTAEQQYDGPGVGVGNNVFAIGTYGEWPWKNDGRDVMRQQDAMRQKADQWVTYFDNARFETPTDFFLYLTDEPGVDKKTRAEEYKQVERWASWLRTHNGPGRRLPTLVTLPAHEAVRYTPSLTIPTSTLSVGRPDVWQPAVDQLLQSPEHDFWMYNGHRPASGTLVIEDDGVAMRQLVWSQFRAKASRWFVWQGTYYKNFQGNPDKRPRSDNADETRLFSSAKTFGAFETSWDNELGVTGENYNNGDGVLFYPGTDRIYPDESYDAGGPIASLRLKHWRRGLQDYEYLVAANAVDPHATGQIVQHMIPRVLWDVGVDDPGNPHRRRTDISWPTNPDLWHDARRALLAIIERASR